VARTPSASGQLRARLEAALSARLSPERTLVLAILLPTLVFVAARSMLGFARWRLQRELWRRDVERLEAPER
jgi:hypothetical protein